MGTFRFLVSLFLLAFAMHAWPDLPEGQRIALGGFFVVIVGSGICRAIEKGGN